MSSLDARRRFRQVNAIFLLAVAYYLTGKLGLLLALPPGYATAVFPASGIALASLILFGYRLWPGVLLGSFLLNVTNGFDSSSTVRVIQALSLAVSIGTGASLQALTGTLLVRRFVGQPGSLAREQDIITLLLLGGPVSCVLSASWGLTSLWLAGLISPANLAFSWWTWWIGDSIGVLIFTPLMLIWTSTREQIPLQRRLLVSTPLLLMFLLTVLLFIYTSSREQERIRLGFVRQTDNLTQLIRKNFDGYLDSLYAIEGLYLSSVQVTREEFHKFVVPLLARHPGILAASSNLRIADAGRAAHELAARRQGYRDYRINDRDAQGRNVTAARRAEYFPVYYVEPYSGNAAAMGFDTAVDPVKYQAMEQARDTGQAVGTGRIVLVQDKAARDGFIIYLPLYQNGQPHRTPAQRRTALQGYIAGVFRISDVLGAALQGMPTSGIGIRLLDTTLAGAPAALFYARGAPAPGAPWSNADFRLAGRGWRLEFSPSQDYLDNDRSLQAWGVLASGMLFTGLLGVILLIITGRTTQIEEHVRSRTAELRFANDNLRHSIALRQLAEQVLRKSETRLNAVVDNVGNGIIAINEQGVIESFNPAAARMFGYSQAEAIGRNITLLMPEHMQQLHELGLKQYLATGQPRLVGKNTIEVPGRRKDGAVFQLELGLNEMRLDEQRLFVGILHDITERKTAEEELRKSEKRFRTIFDDAPIGIARLDVQGRILDTNPGLQAMLGYSNEELRRMALDTCLHPEDAVQSWHIFHQLIQGAIDQYQLEARYYRRDGSLLWANATASVVHDAADKPRFIIAMLRDTTVRREMEEVIREERQFLQAVLENITDGIVACDAVGNLTLFNRATRTFHGLSETPLPPQHWAEHYDLFQADGQTPMRVEDVPLFRALNGETVRDVEMVIAPAHLKKRTMLVSGQAVIDVTGKKIGAVVSMHDVTEKKRTEHALQESSGLQRAILDSAGYAIMTTDLAGAICTFNNTAQVMLGYAAQQLIGKASLLKLHDPEELSARAAQLTRELGENFMPGFDAVVGKARRLGVDEHEWTYIRANGERFPVLLSMTALRDTQGALTGFVGIASDISERKQIERMKNEFISTVSHELRTPLTSIRGSLGLIRGGLAGPLPLQAQNLVDIAYNNSERLGLLINDILDIERIESGKMQFRLRPLYLMTIVEQAMMANRDYAAQFGVTFILRHSLPAARVNADSDRLMQVLANLLSNAAKFSPVNGTVEISVTRCPEGFRVAVIDYGPGIPADFQDRIFQRFAQADSSDTRQKGGTGLGLSIVKVIIEKLGGRAGFISEPPSPTCFYFDLPEWREPGKSLPRPAPDNRQRPQVLICEHDPAVAQLIQAMLGEGGFISRIAHDAGQARRYLAEQQYGVLTLDILAPEQDGVSLIRELRTQEGTRFLPIVVVSAQTPTTLTQINGDAFAVVDWLDKPVDPQRLLQAVKRAVHGRARILHVEDDPDILHLVAVLLREFADISPAASLSTARQLFAAQPFDLVILDLILPDGNGAELLPLLYREQGHALPVIIFSAHELPLEDAQHVSAALVKSRVSNQELLHTIRALIDRIEESG